jgi:hypothetical protein
MTTDDAEAFIAASSSTIKNAMGLGFKPERIIELQAKAITSSFQDLPPRLREEMITTLLARTLYHMTNLMTNSVN